MSIRTTTEKILSVLGCEEFLVSLSFVTNEEIATLNKKYRNKSGATDVLSFPQLSKNELSPVVSFVKDKKPSNVAFLGDIVLCPEVAMDNANKAKKTLPQEITFLIIHSALHLLGYDHHEAIEAKRMRLKEREVLAAIEKSSR